ncbi:MAG: MCE family protein [Bacteroidetes bacterium]|nr:MCE family protein [Bacteroidota bacterium]
MQKRTGNKIRLGIFVTVSITLFIAAIYLIGERQQLFSDTFHVSGVFKNIDGLQIGNNVHFSGINVGIVEDIQQITDSTVKVDMSINMDTKKFIKKDAKALIGSDGLMGNKIVQIIPGSASNQELSDNDYIKTIQSVSIDEILGKIKVTADNAAIITTDLAIVMENIKNGKGTIGKLFMDSTLAQTLDDAMINIKQGAGGFKQNMDAAGHNVLLRGYIKNKKNDKDK